MLKTVYEIVSIVINYLLLHLNIAFSIMIYPYYSSQTTNIQENSTVLQKDSLLKKEEIITINQKTQSPKKTNILQLIEDGYDATSYYYTNWQKHVPLSNIFLQHKALYKTTTVQKEPVKTQKVNNTFFKESDILLLILLLLLGLIAYVKVNTKDYIKKISTSVISFAYSRTLQNEHTKIYLLKDWILLFTFYISSGVLIVQVLSYFNIDLQYSNKILSYFYISAIVFGLSNIYQIIIRLVSMLSFNVKPVLEYLFYFNNLLKFLGIFQIIILSALLYAPENSRIYFIYLIIFTYLIISLLRIYKIFYDFLTNQFSLIYFILYFCALEIVPIMVLAKTIIKLLGA